MWKAVLVGVPLPLCSCGVIPAGLGLHKDGAGKGATVGFLISTPQTGIDSILVSASFLGWPFALLKVAAAFVTGILGGTAANVAGGFDDSARQQASNPRSNVDRRAAFFAHVYELIFSIRYWLVFGVLLSAAISVWLPDIMPESLRSAGSLSSMLAALVISLPLYVCATASVPIAAALVQSGLSAGAALVFLMAGPATNLATLGAVYRTLGMRTLLIYLASIIAGSLCCGLLFDQWIDLSAVHSHVHGPHNAWWQVTSGILLAIGLVYAIANDTRRWLRPSIAETAQHFQITGMTCDGCAMTLERSLLKHPEIHTAQVSFADKQALITGTISKQHLTAAVENVGFEVCQKESIS